MTRRKGFTLIELLVVIAIIGILAAMLFPVFARARESARKTQCLSNVKNIALAINMYLTDYDRFFPRLVDKQAADFWNNHGIALGRKPAGYGWPQVCNHGRQADPYLRVEPILDDYIKNRDVWRCPSARIMYGAYNIIPMGRDGYWLNNFLDHPTFQRKIEVCYLTYPAGWGGDVTDSFVQGPAQIGMFEHGWGPAGRQVFVQGIGVNDSIVARRTDSWANPSRVVVCGDSAGGIWKANCIAYPDLYAASWSGCGMPDPDCAIYADWAGCTWTQNCGLDFPHLVQFFKDPVYRKTWTRHIGGSNLGYMDGHAQWMPADTIIFHGSGTADPQLDGDIEPDWYPDLLVY